MATPKRKPAGRATPKRVAAPKEITVDINALTWDDFEAIEDQSKAEYGRAWFVGDLFSGDKETEGQPTSRGIRAFIWLDLRKRNAAVTLKEVGKLKFTATRLATSKPPDPTEAGS